MIKTSFTSLIVTLYVLILTSLFLLFLYLDQSSTLKYERMKLETEKLKSEGLEQALESLKINKSLRGSKRKIIPITGENYHVIVLDMSEEPENTTLAKFFWTNYMNSEHTLDSWSAHVDSKDQPFGDVKHNVCTECGRYVIVRIIYPDRVEEKSYTYFKNAVK